MKTPKQIALDAILRNYNGREGLSESLAYGDVDADGVQAMIVAAIEADRAQHDCELGVDLPSGQRIMVWVGTSGADGSALVQVDTANAEGNLRIFVNDNDQPIFDENPETGKYEDMAPENEEDDDDAP